MITRRLNLRQAFAEDVDMEIVFWVGVTVGSVIGFSLGWYTVDVLRAMWLIK